jgi:hypothetical protein
MGNMMADQFTLASFSRPPLAMYTSNLILTQRRVAALKAGIGSTIRNDHFRLLAANHADVPDLAQSASARCRE